MYDLAYYTKDINAVMEMDDDEFEEAYQAFEMIENEKKKQMNSQRKGEGGR